MGLWYIAEEAKRQKKEVTVLKVDCPSPCTLKSYFDLTALLEYLAIDLYSTLCSILCTVVLPSSLL